MTPEYLRELADLVDPDQLWRRPVFEPRTPEQRRQLDAGVALRRYAEHVRELRALIGTGRSLLITPMSTSSSAHMTVEIPEEHLKLLRHHDPRPEN